MLGINTNIPSLNVQRQLNATQSGRDTSLERLSSGLRVNNADDDAAGLSIGNRMTAQLRGQSQAYRNTNDGISLLNVAEGNLSSIVANTQRIRDLAVQSSNGTYSPSDRKAMQDEVDQLMAASFAANDQASFNNIPLFNGSFSAGFQVGANVGDTVNVTLPKVMTTPVTVTTPATTIVTPEHTVTTPEHTVTTPATTTSVPWYYESADSPGSTPVQAPLNAGDLILNGVPIPATVAGAGVGQTTDSAWAVRNAIAAAGVPNLNYSIDTTVNGGFVQNVWSSTGVDIPSAETIAAGAIVINGVPMDAISASFAAPINTITGLYNSFMNNANGDPSLGIGAASLQAGAGFELLAISLSANDGANLDLQETVPGSLAKLGLTAGLYRGRVDVSTYAHPGVPIVIAGNHPEHAGLDAGTTGPYIPAHSVPGGVTVTTIPETTVTIPETTVTIPETTVTIPGTTTIVSGDPGSDVLTQENAQKMLGWADQKLQSVNGTRGYIGSVQSRFESIVSNLLVSSENVSASRSRIMDTDYAKETVDLARNQILQQAGNAMLAQAGGVVKNVLSLLPK